MRLAIKVIFPGDALLQAQMGAGLLKGVACSCRAEGRCISRIERLQYILAQWAKAAPQDCSCQFAHAFSRNWMMALAHWSFSATNGGSLSGCGAYSFQPSSRAFLRACSASCFLPSASSELALFFQA